MSTHGTPNTEALLANADWVRALARRLVSDPDAADDIVQNAWTSALQHPPQREQSLPGFLRSIVVNLARSKFREDRHRELREHRAAREESLASTADVIERLATHKLVVAAVEALDEPYRTAILLRYFDGLPPGEIAKKLNVPVKTIGSRLHRGLKQLRARLDRELGPERHNRLAALCVATLARDATRPHWSRLAPLGRTILVSTQVKVAACALVIALGAALWWMHSTNRFPTIESNASVVAVGPGSAAATTPLAARSSSDREPASAGGDATTHAVVAATPEDQLELRGRILDSSEHPVAGARIDVRESLVVTSYLFDGRDRPQDVLVANGVSDERGEFEFTLPIGRPYMIAVEADGYAPTCESYHHPGGDVVIHVSRPASIRGRVLSKVDHAPISGARVSVKSWMKPWRSIDVQTDAGGAFAVPEVDAGSETHVTVEAQHWSVESLVLDVHEVEVITRDVELLAGNSVSGIVRDAISKQVIAGAEVHADEGPDAWPRTKTDLSGQFVLDGIRTNKLVYVRVRADRYPRTERLVRMDHGSVADLTFDLAPSRIWRGRVVLADGSPVAEAWVSAKGEVREGSDDWESVRTRADGTFELTHLRTDVHHLLLVHKDHCGMSALHLPDLDADQGKQDVSVGDIVLLRGATLSGVVIDEDGDAIAGVNVGVRSQSRDRFARVTVPADIDDLVLDRRDIITDARGRFAFADLAAGPCRFSFYKTGLVGRSDEHLDLAEGEIHRDWRVTLPAKLGIEGRVVDADGAPCAGAFVRAEREPDGTESAVGRTDEHGLFRVAGLHQGSYTVSADPRYDEDGSFRTISGSVNGVAAGTREVLVVVPHFTWIEGLVVGPDGAPVPHAIVYGYDPRGTALGSTLADEHGHFRYKVAVDTTTDFAAGWTTANDHEWNGYRAIDDAGSQAHQLAVAAGKRDVVLKLGPRP